MAAEASRELGVFMTSPPTRGVTIIADDLSGLKQMVDGLVRNMPGWSVMATTKTTTAAASLSALENALCQAAERERQSPCGLSRGAGRARRQGLRRSPARPASARCSRASGAASRTSRRRCGPRSWPVLEQVPEAEGDDAADPSPPRWTRSGKTALGALNTLDTNPARWTSLDSENHEPRPTARAAPVSAPRRHWATPSGRCLGGARALAADPQGVDRAGALH